MVKYIHVKVNAGVRKEFFIQKSEDHFVATIREKAERNMANSRVLELISNHFKILKSKVRIINGHRSPSKLLIVED